MQACLKPAYDISADGADSTAIRQHISNSADNCHRLLDCLRGVVQLPGSSSPGAAAVEQPKLTLPDSWPRAQAAASAPEQLDAASLTDRERAHLWSLCAAIATAQARPQQAARAAAELQALELCLGAAVAALKTWLASGDSGRPGPPPLNLYQLRMTGAPLGAFQGHMQQEMGWGRLAFVPSQAAPAAKACLTSKYPALPSA